MKLRIAYIVPSFPSTTETFVVNQIVDMIDRGHDVRIYAFRKDQNAVVHQTVKDYGLIDKTVYYEEAKSSIVIKYANFVAFLYKNFKNISFRKLLKNYKLQNLGRALSLRYYYKYYWILEKNKDPQIAHVHFGDKGRFVANLKEDGFFTRTKLVVSFHGYDLEPANLDRLREIYKPVFKNVDLLTVNSLYTKTLLEKITCENRIEILPVGLDTKEFNMLARPKKDNFNILFLGRFIEFKGPHLALDIFEILRDKGYQEISMTMVGDGPLLEQIKNRINSKNLTDFVLLKGALSQAEIIEEYKNADIFLLPGIYDKNDRAETQGLVIQEAQSMQLPVVVSDAGGMKYGLIPDETGYVVKEGDLNAFADRIEFLLLNEKESREMGKKGREFVEKNFDSNVLGNKLEALYLELLENNKLKTNLKA